MCACHLCNDAMDNSKDLEMGEEDPSHCDGHNCESQSDRGSNRWIYVLIGSLLVAGAVVLIVLLACKNKKKPQEKPHHLFKPSAEEQALSRSPDMNDLTRRYGGITDITQVVPKTREEINGRRILRQYKVTATDRETAKTPQLRDFTVYVVNSVAPKSSQPAYWKAYHKRNVGPVPGFADVTFNRPVFLFEDGQWRDEDVRVPSLIPLRVDPDVDADRPDDAHNPAAFALSLGAAGYTFEIVQPGGEPARSFRSADDSIVKCELVEVRPEVEELYPRGARFYQHIFVAQKKVGKTKITDGQVTYTVEVNTL